MRWIDLAEFGVRSTVSEQRIGGEFGLVDRGTTDLARPIRPVPQAFERAIDVIQRRLDQCDALVVGLWHAMNLLAPVPIATPNRLKGTTTGVAASFCRDR